MKSHQAKTQRRRLTETDCSLPYNRKLVERARDLRKHMTLAESKLWDSYLREHRFRFLRQRPIDHFIVDFYCATSKLVIEVDGELHSQLENREYDSVRDEILQSYGLRVLRISNKDILENFDMVCRRIDDMLGTC